MDDEPDVLRLSESFSHQLSVTARRVALLFAKHYASSCRINPAEWKVLATISEKETVSPTGVGVATGLDKVSVSRAVSSLSNRGMVKQSADPRDGRARQLSLTRKGATACDAASVVTRELEAALVGNISKTDLAAMRRILDQLNAQASKLAAGTSKG